MYFEWDEAKREKTIAERGIDFIDAARIWRDPQRQECIDTRSNYGEVRKQTVGRVALGILFVVYTERRYEGDVEVIRIISARKANRRERLMYERHSFGRSVAV